MKNKLTTGRLTSKEPNIQNIPFRTEEGERIREAFSGHRQEGSGEPTFGSVPQLEVSNDIHVRTAVKMFGVSPKEVSPEMRRLAKMINFLDTYGLKGRWERD